MNDNSSLSFKNIFKRETKLASYIIICLTVVVLSLSYAMFFQVDSNSKNQVVTAGDLKFTYTDGTQITPTDKAKCFEPMTQDEALLYSADCGYQFSVQNTGSLKASYTLKLLTNPANTIEKNKLKIILKKKVGESLEVVAGFPKTLSDLSNDILLTDELNSKDILVFSVQVYVDEATATVSDTSKTISFQIEGTGVVHDNQPLNTDYSATNVISELAKFDTANLAYDNTPDNNLRYRGANPNNYVTFNNETWRIIGVMNNLDDGTGKKESRLKIIRGESNYPKVAWDTNNVNDWTTSSLQTELNSTYLGSLSEEAQNMIGNTIWKIGGSNTVLDVTPELFYERERGTTVYNGRPTEWAGKIGLMYPSDFGYATTGGATTNRDACLAKALYNWDEVADCYNNNWLYNVNPQWTLTHFTDSSNWIFNVYSSTHVNDRDASRADSSATPVIYLKSDVKIQSGSGSSGDPYILSLT